MFCCDWGFFLGFAVEGIELVGVDFTCFLGTGFLGVLRWMGWNWLGEDGKGPYCKSFAR